MKHALAARAASCITCTTIEQREIALTILPCVQYAITGLANNEFSGKSYRDPGNIDPKYVPNGQLGTLVLENYQFNIGSKWRCVLAYCCFQCRLGFPIESSNFFFLAVV